MTAGEESVTAPPEPATLRRVPWRWSDLAIGVGVIASFQTVAVIARANQVSIPRSVYWSLYFVPTLGWTALYPLYIAHRRAARLLVRVPSLWRIVIEVVAAGFLTFAMMMAIGISIVLWQKWANRQFASQGPFADAQGAPFSFLLAYSLFGATIGPVCEELFFRGFVYNALRQRLGIVVAMILQAALFALMHPFEMGQRIVVFGIGVALGSVYEWRKTLLTPMLMHCFFNGIAFVIALLAFLHQPYLGVTAVAQDDGCRITSVLPESPADKAGLEIDEILVSCDGQPMHSIEDVRRFVAKHQAGDVIELQVLRGDQSLVVPVTLEPRRLQ